MHVVHRCRFTEWRPAGIHALAFNASGSRLAVARGNGDIELWSMRYQWFCERRIQGNGEALTTALFWVPTVTQALLPSASGRDAHNHQGQTQTRGVERLFSVGLNGKIVEWDLWSLLPKHVADSFGGAVWSAALSPSRTQLIVGCEDGSLRLFDISDPSEPPHYVRPFTKHSSRVLSVDWSAPAVPPPPLSASSSSAAADAVANGMALDMAGTIASGGADGRIRTWNPATGRNLLQLSVEKLRTERAALAANGLDARRSGSRKGRPGKGAFGSARSGFTNPDADPAKAKRRAAAAAVREARRRKGMGKSRGAEEGEEEEKEEEEERDGDVDGEDDEDGAGFGEDDYDEDDEEDDENEEGYGLDFTKAGREHRDGASGRGTGDGAERGGRGRRSQQRSIATSLVWSVRFVDPWTLVSGTSLGHVQFWELRFGTLVKSVASHHADVLALTVIPAAAPSSAVVDATDPSAAAAAAAGNATPVVYATGIDSKVTQISAVVPHAVTARVESARREGAPLPAHNFDWVISAAHRSHSHDVLAIVVSPPILAPSVGETDSPSSSTSSSSTSSSSSSSSSSSGRDDADAVSPSSKRVKSNSSSALSAAMGPLRPQRFLVTGGIDSQLVIYPVSSFARTSPRRISPAPHHSVFSLSRACAHPHGPRPGRLVPALAPLFAAAARKHLPAAVADALAAHPNAAPHPALAAALTASAPRHARLLLVQDRMLHVYGLGSAGPLGHPGLRRPRRGGRQGAVSMAEALAAVGAMHDSDLSLKEPFQHVVELKVKADLNLTCAALSPNSNLVLCADPLAIKLFALLTSHVPAPTSTTATASTAAAATATNGSLNGLPNGSAAVTPVPASTEVTQVLRLPFPPAPHLDRSAALNRSIRTLSCSGASALAFAPSVLQSSSSSSTAAAAAPGGLAASLVAVACNDGAVYVVDLASWRVLARLQGDKTWSFIPSPATGSSFATFSSTSSSSSSAVASPAASPADLAGTRGKKPVQPTKVSFSDGDDDDEASSSSSSSSTAPSAEACEAREAASMAFWGMTPHVRRIAFSPCARFLAVTDDALAVRVYALPDLAHSATASATALGFTHVCTLPALSEPCTALAFLPHIEPERLPPLLPLYTPAGVAAINASLNPAAAAAAASSSSAASAKGGVSGTPAPASRAKSLFGSSKPPSTPGLASVASSSAAASAASSSASSALGAVSQLRAPAPVTSPFLVVVLTSGVFFIYNTAHKCFVTPKLPASSASSSSSSSSAGALFALPMFVPRSAPRPGTPAAAAAAAAAAAGTGPATRPQQRLYDRKVTHISVSARPPRATATFSAAYSLLMQSFSALFAVTIPLELLYPAHFANKSAATLLLRGGATAAEKKRRRDLVALATASLSSPAAAAASGANGANGAVLSGPVLEAAAMLAPAPPPRVWASNKFRSLLFAGFVEPEASASTSSTNGKSPANGMSPANGKSPNGKSAGVHAMSDATTTVGGKAALEGVGAEEEDVSTVAVVEAAWLRIMAELPPSLRRRKYGRQ